MPVRKHLGTAQPAIQQGQYVADVLRSCLNEAGGRQPVSAGPAATEASGKAASAAVRHDPNTVRLHAAIGYVTLADEHQGHGPRIRAAENAGLRHARWVRITYHQIQQVSHPPEPNEVA